jgi:hypothetical protein
MTTRREVIPPWARGEINLAVTEVIQGILVRENTNQEPVVAF